MADSKQLRQFAAQQVPAPTAMRGKRPEDLDDQGRDAEQAETEAQDASAADSMSSEAPVSEPLHTARVATDAAAGTEGGPSAALIGAGALGAVGLVVAVAGGGGGKSGDFKPPVIGTLDPDVPPPKPERPTPRPTPEEPKPEQPKPGDQKPQEPAPNPEGQTKPDQPANPNQPTNPGGNPQTPDPGGNSQAPTNSSGTSPEEQKPDPDMSVPPVKPSAPIVSLANDTGNYWEETKSDGITSDATLKVSGISDGVSWRYSIDGGEWKIGVGSEISRAEFLEGVHSVRVKQIDGAGRESEATDFAFQLDASAPDRMTATVAAGILADGGHIEVHTEMGASWEYSIDAGASWHQGGNSAQLAADDVSLPNGSATALFRQADVAGNPSETSSLHFTLSKAGAPRVSLKNDNGFSNSDHVTSDATVRVEDLPAGSTWQYSLDSGKTWVTGQADGLIAPTAFGYFDGEKSVWVKAVDLNDLDGGISKLEFSFAANVVRPSFSPEIVGSAGADRFTFGGYKRYRLQGFNVEEGDVIDLTGLVTLPPETTALDHLSAFVPRTDPAIGALKGIQFGDTLIDVGVGYYDIVPVVYGDSVFMV